MRLLLGIALFLLFLWLYKAQMSNRNSQEHPCEAASIDEAVALVLLSPLSLYSSMSSTLFRLVLSLPALVLSSLSHSLLVLLALPWCVASVSLALLLTGLHVALYLLHLGLVVATLAILTLTQHKTDARNTTEDDLSYQERKEKETNTKLIIFGRRVTHQG